jgi:hypothetical protein
LKLEVLKNDTKAFLISCWTDVPNITAESIIFYPPSIHSIDNRYDYTNVQLSAVQYKHNTTSQFLTGISTIWPFNFTLGRAISWRGESSTTNDLKLSARFLKTGDLFDISNTTVSGWSISADYVQLTSTNLTHQTYTVSSFFAEAEGTPDKRIPYVYTFNYDPIVSEDISFTTITQDLTSEIVNVQRAVLGESGVLHYNNLLYPIIWSGIDSYGTYITACSGIVPNDLSNLKYYGCTVGTNLTGNVGLLSTVNFYDVGGNISASNSYYGLDYLKLKYKNDPDQIYTLQVAYSGNPFVDSTNISQLHTFQVYSAPTAVYLSAVALDNAPFVRSLTAKLLNDKNGTYVPLHPANKIKWNMTNSISGGSNIYNLDGSAYNGNNYTYDTVVVKLTSETFDYNDYGRNCTFNLQASSFNNYNDPEAYVYSASANRNVIIDTFPSVNLNLRTNYENSSAITDMYREKSTSYVLSTYDNSWFSNNPIVSGTRLIEYGDGRTTTAQSSSIVCNNATAALSTIKLFRTGVSASNWLSSHDFEADINLHFVTSFLSADFVVWPKYVFTSNTTQVINTSSVITATNGVSSYDVDHTEIFYLSASDTTAPTYNWYVDNSPLIFTMTNKPAINITTSTTTPTSGLPIKLRLHNDELPPLMPETFNSDINGVTMSYPNTKETDNSSIYFQNMKLLAYDTPTLQINSYSDNIIITTTYPITATKSVSFPASTPLYEAYGVSQWFLSTLKWTITGTDDDFSTNLVVGYTDDLMGTLKYGTTTPLVLTIKRDSDTSIPNTFAPNDWGTNSTTEITSVNINYIVAPVLSFTPRHRYGIIGEDIYIFNNTLSSNLLTGFSFFDGNSSYYHRTDYSDFLISAYPIEGTFNFGITGELSGGQTYTNTIYNAITILSTYPEYDPNITRVFGTEELTLPYTLEQVKIPINEWGVADNFNNSINRMNSNMEYMINMTKFYSLPPIDFIGWLGSYNDDNYVKFGWNIVDYPNYHDLTTSLSDATLSAINDVVAKNNILYVADTNKVELFDMRLNPPLLHKITNKTIDDAIAEAKAVDVDSTGRIYILDAPKHRVLVFDAYKESDVVISKFLYEWGGLGGKNSKMKFNNPNDLVIDLQDNVWIVDTNNIAIKKYTRTGSWLQTLLPTEITGTTPETDGIISIAFDTQNDIHVLTKTKVYKYTYEGVFINSYSYTNPDNNVPLKIQNMYNSGFLYVACPTCIIKIQENGKYAGIIGREIANANFNSIYHDENNSLYVANTQNILQYFDVNVVNNSLFSEFNNVKWDISDLLVNKNEYIQDWVCNISFKRFWDNIELFRRCLLGSVSYVTNGNGIAEIVITNYTPEEYASMYLTSKDNMFVGVNELVTSDVLNRCIAQLHNNMLNILQHI